MIGYASNTGTRRNLQALRDNGWRILLTPDNPTPREGLRYGIDNGAWGAFQKQQPFDVKAFKTLVERRGGAADFVIVPDIVAGGEQSLDFSASWLPYLRPIRNLLLPVQDGMNPSRVGAWLSAWTNLGVFLGGSTEWKLRTMYGWGMVAHSHGRHYHVGRVNSKRRIRLAHEAGADSIDGTSATMYSCFRAWAHLHRVNGGSDPAYLLAMQHADLMEQWARRHGKKADLPKDLAK